MEKGIPEVFSDGVNPKIKFSHNKGNFHVIKAIFTRSHIFQIRFRLAQIVKTTEKDYFYRNSYNKWVKLLKYNY